ncbi:hypothetical protein LR002_00405 [Candidatus Gracilibacteria bacterium]|nr:hypothetical protein [Candidatus Gracilibacteria bacterium]
MGFKRGTDGKLVITQCEGYCQTQGFTKPCGEGCRNEKEPDIKNTEGLSKNNENLKESLKEAQKIISKIEKNSKQNIQETLNKF